MSPSAQLTFERRTRTGGRIRLRGQVIATIRRLELRDLKLKPTGKSILDERAGMPLYWRQYAEHGDPERSARYRGEIQVLGQSGTRLQLRIRSSTRSGDMESDFRVSFHLRRADDAIEVRVAARLTVPAGRTWRVTPNPHHGEVTFCTFWPAGAFSPDGTAAKRFDSCLLKPKTGRSRRIPHNHLEGGDKDNLRLKPGDRFAWGVEDENPCLTLLDGGAVEAGLCAYMWDAHFGLRFCRGAEPVDLEGPFERSVSFQIAALSRRTAARWLRESRTRRVGANRDTPVYHGGLHTFQESFRGAALSNPDLWPWQSTVVEGRPDGICLARETTLGYGDPYSLRIDHGAAALSRWEATTLGPAFGEPAFTRGGCLRLTAMVRTDALAGTAWIAIRLHRTGRGSVHSPDDYEIFESPHLGQAPEGWVRLEIKTPPIQPAPDRVHLLLQFKGRGSVWFDNVELSRLPPASHPS
ncbi:MAG: hypothetical protein R3F07_09065 [Opitutaceae bacterium]